MINELPFPVAVFPVAMFNEKYASLHLSYLLLRTPGRDVEGLGVNPSSPRAVQSRDCRAWRCFCCHRCSQPWDAAEKCGVTPAQNERLTRGRLSPGVGISLRLQ